MTRAVLTPAELEANAWASCGPAAVAALLGRPLAEVRPAFPDQREGKTWTNLSMMFAALARLMLRVKATSVDVAAHEGLPAKTWPLRGLVLVQLRGRWDAMPVNHPAQLSHTHWIAVAPAGHPIGDGWTTAPAAFDVNLVGAPKLEKQHGWTALEAWKGALPEMLARQIRGASGGWWVRAGIEVAG